VDADLITVSRLTNVTNLQETKIDRVLERFITLPSFPKEDRFKIRNLAFEVLHLWGPYLEFNYQRDRNRKARQEALDYGTESYSPSNELEDGIAENMETWSQTESTVEDTDATVPISKDPFDQMYHRPFEITTFVTLQKVFSLVFSFLTPGLGAWCFGDRQALGYGQYHEPRGIFLSYLEPRSMVRSRSATDYTRPFHFSAGSWTILHVLTVVLE
jgi:hypothetical protein